MVVKTPDDDWLSVVDDTDGEDGAPHERTPWTILLVDDDPEVHQATLFALRDMELLGHEMRFLHAYSTPEARTILEQHPDVAVALLDVVMESDHAGLELVHWIRHQLNNHEIRVILRTGQPGYAPELEAIRDYDINDYRTKAELTQTRLVTSITAALRTYEQLRAIRASHDGLQRIITATGVLYTRQALEGYAETMLEQLAAMAHLANHSLVCVATGPHIDDIKLRRMVILAAAGSLQHTMSLRLEELSAQDALIRQRILDALIDGHTQIHDDAIVLPVRSQDQGPAVAYLVTPRRLGTAEQRLLEVFSSHVAVGFDNLHLVKRLTEAAYLDRLTRLHNRAAFVRDVDEQIALSHTEQWIAVLDIDNFSEVNDALGHENGDRLLLAIADRLRARFGQRAEVYRLSADAFALRGTQDALDSQEMLKAFDNPFSVAGYALPVRATVALVNLAEEQGSGLDALKNAYIALKRAKNAQKGSAVIFSRDMAVETRERLALLQELRETLANNELMLNFQPQICLRSGRAVGVEALLRWTRRDGRAVSPLNFIPLAESSGLIFELGNWVLREACWTLRRWMDQGLTGLRMAVNVSVAQLLDDRFIPAVEEILQETGIDPSWLEVEITESVMLNGVQTVITTLSRLKLMGFSVALDDFGTGYSSLAYLKQLPIDRLKIDRLFVREIDSDNTDSKIARMIVGLSRSMQLEVLAEGVETELQATILSELDCDEAQGFMYSPPLDPERIVVWLRDNLSTPQTGTTLR